MMDHMKEEFWKAIVECDENFDGIFYYGVMTTGIFCRPSCRSKTPKQQNVKIFHNYEEPTVEGFRPCKRCQPDLLTHSTTKQNLVKKAIQVMSENYSKEIGLTDLAVKLYVSPFYLQRIFKSETAMSPSQFLLNKRIEMAKDLILHTSLSMTEVALEVGFKNSAHFSSVFRKKVGYSPTEYRLKHTGS
jgi:AraC family transcriptional regulator, regulatory protein of adaptative response / methylphosphotriester-DNA alkyltransferase methyltransferase